MLQELVLGIAGWRVVEAVAPDTEICHLNEGHTAFVYPAQLEEKILDFVALATGA